MSTNTRSVHRLAKVLSMAIVAVGLAACGSDDPVAEGSAEQTNGTEAPTTIVDTVELSQLEVARAFWEAVAAADRETARNLIDSEAGREANLFGRAGTLEGQFDWYEAVGFTWELESCTEGGTHTVVCSANARNRWSEALGVQPVTGDFTVWFGDDGILAVVDRRHSFVSQWSPMVFSVFAQWVEKNHPEDAQIMFSDTDVNPEILGLYELNTTRFVEAHEGG